MTSLSKEEVNEKIKLEEKTWQLESTQKKQLACCAHLPVLVLVGEGEGLAGPVGVRPARLKVARLRVEQEPRPAKRITSSSERKTSAEEWRINKAAQIIKCR